MDIVPYVILSALAGVIFVTQLSILSALNMLNARLGRLNVLWAPAETRSDPARSDPTLTRCPNCRQLSYTVRGRCSACLQSGGSRC
jgi:hypothetical protein